MNEEFIKRHASKLVSKFVKVAVPKYNVRVILVSLVSFYVQLGKSVDLSLDDLIEAMKNEYDNNPLDLQIKATKIMHDA